MFEKMISIALGGALGALARYGLGGLVHRWLSASFPWGTVAVNLVGCFLFGLVWAMAAGRWSVDSQTRTLLLVGFMGAFTTFSTFIAESGRLLAHAQMLLAMANILLQVTVGLAVYFLGMIVGRMI